MNEEEPNWNFRIESTKNEIKNSVDRLNNRMKEKDEKQSVNLKIQ